jgi:hypothetical protein
MDGRWQLQKASENACPFSPSCHQNLGVFDCVDCARLRSERRQPRARRKIARPDSLLAARAAYNVPETGQRLKPGKKLGDAYVNANMPVVRQRLYRAGVRLATVLNEVFPDK